MIDQSYILHPRDQVYTVAEIKIPNIDGELARLSQINLDCPPLFPQTLMLLSCIRERYKMWQAREQVSSDFYREIFKLLRVKQCRTGLRIWSSSAPIWMDGITQSTALSRQRGLRTSLIEQILDRNGFPVKSRLISYRRLHIIAS